MRQTSNLKLNRASDFESNLKRGLSFRINLFSTCHILNPSF